MLTREEYNGMLDEHNEVKFLAGGLRSHNGWEQLVFLPTVEEALCFGAYHVSQGHVGSTIETIVLGFSPNEMNLAYNLGQRKVSHFQRAQSIQFLQIHNPFRYKLSDMERDNVRVMSLDFCPADKFQVYTWNNGWMWYFGHPVHARTMLEQQLADPEYIHTTLLTMCLQHLGQYGTTMMEETTQRLINNFRATMGLDTMFVDRDPEAQRGHDNHKAWIMKNQHKGDDKEEIEDKMDDDNDDGDNDDAMGEGKKRKFQQWLTMMSTMKFIKVTMMEKSAVLTTRPTTTQYCTTSRQWRLLISQCRDGLQCMETFVQLDSTISWTNKSLAAALQWCL